MEKKHYSLFIIALGMIGISLFFFTISFLNNNINLQSSLKRISYILSGIGIILFYYKYKNKKLLYFGYFMQITNVVFFIIYFIITLRNKEWGILIYIVASSYLLYDMSKYLYKINDLLIMKILGIIVFYNKNIKYRLAWIYFENYNYKKSISIIKKYKDNESYYLLAMNYEKLKEYNNAIEIYTKILENDSNERPDILYNRGAMYKKTGNYENAIKDFNNCIKCKVPDPKAYIALGVIKDENGEYDEAKELFIKGDSMDGSYKEYIPERYK